MDDNSIPVTTQWLLDATGNSGRAAIESVYMLINNKSQSKGTAFSLNTGVVVSNWHVVEDATTDNLVAISSKGTQIRFEEIVVDKNRDLVVLRPQVALKGGLSIKKDINIPVGTQVLTWGYPLGYNGPAPLLSVGYLSGFNDSPPYEETASIIKHLVVNSAFNPGNSGGPLMVSGEDKVIGVVVSKHAPLTQFVASAIKALSQSGSGVVFNYQDQSGNTKSMVEAQVVAEVLKYFHSLTQVMIGEAIASSELISFLDSEGIPY